MANYQQQQAHLDMRAAGRIDEMSARVREEGVCQFGHLCIVCGRLLSVTPTDLVTDHSGEAGGHVR